MSLSDSHFIIRVRLTDGLFIHFVIEQEYAYLFTNNSMDIRIFNLFKVPCISERLREEEISENDIEFVDSWTIQNFN